MTTKEEKQHYFELLNDLIQQIEEKLGHGKQKIFDTAFGSNNEFDKKALNKKYWDLVSGGKGLSNAFTFYERIIMVYRDRIESVVPMKVSDKTTDELILQKLDFIIEKLNLK